MFDFDSYIRLLREDPKTIVLPEGTDPVSYTHLRAHET